MGGNHVIVLPIYIYMCVREGHFAICVVYHSYVPRSVSLSVQRSELAGQCCGVWLVHGFGGGMGCMMWWSGVMPWWGAWWGGLG